uniref:Predicted protein n=1 Tax=Physcomitrium patens TaxID=3218 RepID=A9U4G3_PHYPA
MQVHGFLQGFAAQQGRRISRLLCQEVRAHRKNWLQQVNRLHDSGVQFVRFCTSRATSPIMFLQTTKVLKQEDEESANFENLFSYDEFYLDKAQHSESQISEEKASSLLRKKLGGSGDGCNPNEAALFGDSTHTKSRRISGIVEGIKTHHWRCGTGVESGLLMSSADSNVSPSKKDFPPRPLGSCNLIESPSKTSEQLVVMRFWKKACYLQIFLLLTTRKHGDRYQRIAIVGDSWAGCDTSPEIDRGHWRDAYKIRFCNIYIYVSVAHEMDTDESLLRTISSDQVRISLCNYSTSSNCSRTAYTSPTGARNATTQPWHCRKMIDLKRTPFARQGFSDIVFGRT